VEPVLDGLALGDLEEYQVGSDAILGAALRRLEADLVFLLPRRRQPSTASQKLAILAGSVASMHKHWMRSSMC
jgi:hypothetical protein